MGARIAAHLANAGVRCALLDMVPRDSPAARNRLAQAGIEAAKKSRPAAFFVPDFARLIQPGNFDDNLDWCKDADWIIEAVVEDLEIKRDLLARVEQHRRPGTIITTNTSGLPIRLVAEGRSEDFQAHWAGTHFFNPPRYMKLVELIAGPKTKPEVLAALDEFCDRRLGKGVVAAKDTPNFIANRIGTFSLLNALRLMMEIDLTVEDVDGCTGPAIGQPKSATFRTADLVGLDVLAHVVGNIYDSVPDDESREIYKLPRLIDEMTKRGWLGEKTGSGFYKRVRNSRGESEILTLDWKKMEYRPRQKEKFASLEAGKTIEDTGERLRAFLNPLFDGKVVDKAARFIWGALSETCLYAARRVPEIAERIVEVDRAMRWGFGWELGPFEIWDAIGVERMAQMLKMLGKPMPPAVTSLGSSGKKTFYQSAAGHTSYFDLADATYQPVEEPPGIILLKSLREQAKVLEGNSGASLVDLGDGVVCCEFHAKMNAIGGDIIAMLHAGLKRLQSDFDAMVIANQAVNFSVGANLMLLLVSAQEQEWDDLHQAVRQFQNVNMALKYAPRPVVAAPQGMALGGGCEISLHAARIHAAAEAYIGLVETGVGLIPAGGGSKEMMIRANEHASGREDLDLFHAMKPVFETIAMAKVGTSAEDCRALGYLRPSDLVAMHRERLLADAKETALAMFRAGYHAPAPPPIRVLGEEMLAAAKLAIHQMLRGAYISDYDALVAGKLAHVLAGGVLSAPQTVSEQYVLDLEREAFVSLCGERQTQDRIAHTLKTGKPLRN